MKIVLLSGGSGKRLWPLSNDQRSKQFIKILRNNGKLESMVQRVWRQLGELNMQKDAYIATGEAQRSILKSQLGINDSKIISEPSRRDTFPAIALASSYLKTIVGVNEDEIITVLPVDPYVDISFFEKIKDIEELLKKDHATLGLVGITPTYPSEKYGYIVPSNSNDQKVKRFTEKPTRAEAEVLIDNGAVWNAGVFGFKLGTILNVLKERKITTDFQELVSDYEILPRNSFDYEFSEKQSNIVFTQYRGYWKDLGTWNTLTEEMDTESVGYTTELIDTVNTNVINETNTPVAVIGVSNLVVAAGPEGVLVTTKEESPRVKEISNDFFKSVRYIEEDWGVRHTLVETGEACTTHYEVLDGKSVNLELGQNQNLIRLSGEGTIAKTGFKYKLTGHDAFNFLVVTEEK